MKKSKKVLVLGSGAGGLASALVLQSKGSQVTILEKNERVGGKLNRDLMDGYVFDTGPSILTLPTVLKELFESTGARLEDYLTLVNLDPQWRCWFEDGTRFDFRSGEEAMCDEIAKFAPEDIDGFRKLSLKAREMYRISEDNFFFRDVGNVLDIMRGGRMDALEGLRLAVAIEPLKTYGQLVDQHIKHPRLRQALEHLPQYVGSSPFLSPAILACLIHVQFEKGCWYPMGGMNKISEAMAKRFVELGGEIVINSPVSRVYEDHRVIRGVETTDGKLWSADEYVVNIDYNSFNGLLGRKTDLEQELACSGVTVFLGLSKRVKDLAHHNFFFSNSHEKEFEDIYKHRLPAQDPTIYACVPSLTDDSVAPKGKENVFLLIHAPTVNAKTDWDRYLPEYVKTVEGKLARMGFDVEDYGVELRHSTSPAGIGARWNTFRGNIYGSASHGLLKGGFKRKNKASEFFNLQFAGGTVNPGAGVPMSVMSGMIAGANVARKSSGFEGVQL